MNIWLTITCPQFIKKPFNWEVIQCPLVSHSVNRLADLAWSLCVLTSDFWKVFQALITMIRGWNTFQKSIVKTHKLHAKSANPFTEWLAKGHCCTMFYNLVTSQADKLAKKKYLSVWMTACPRQADKPYFELCHVSVILSQCMPYFPDSIVTGRISHFTLAMLQGKLVSVFENHH